LSLIKSHKPSASNHHSNANQSFVQQTVLQRGKNDNQKDNQTEQESAKDVQLKNSPFGAPPLKAEPFVRQTVFGQAKLNIGQPNDKYEVEADRVADKVVSKSNAPAPPVQKKDAGGPKESEGVNEGEVQMKSAPEQETEIQEKPISESITTGIQLKPIAPTEDAEVQKMEAEPEGEAEVQMKLDASTEAPENIQKAEAPAEESDLQKTAIQTKCSSCGKTESAEKLNVQQKCASCEGEEKSVQKMEAQPESEAEVQTKSDSASNSGADVESSLKSSKGKGSAMDDNTRSSMESGFGADFSGVRIHTDSKAEKMNQDLGAKAFTNGSDVYFNKGQYNPSTDSGKHLLAHELTHTVQQGASPSDVQKLSANQDETPIQAKLDEYEKPEHGKNTEKRLNNELDERTGGETPEPSDEPPSKSEKKAEMNELEGPTKPRINESAIQLPKTKEEKKQGEEKIENPKKLIEDKETEKKKLPQKKGPTIDQIIQQYQQEEIKAQAKATQVPKPEEPQEVAVPDPIDYSDAEGKAITPDMEGETIYAASLAKISDLRMQGFMMQNEGADFKKKGFQMQEKVNSLHGRVSNAEKTVGQMEEAIKVRHEAVEKGQEGLSVAKEKQAKFQEESPQYKTKVDESKSETDDVVSEGESVKSANESTQPEDAEDRQNSGEAGGQLGQVNSKSESIADTLGTVQSDLDELIIRNTEAGQKNIETGEKLTDTSQKLTQADTHLAMLKETNVTAKAEIESHASEPDEMNKKADTMISAGENAVKDSIKLEKRLNTVEKEFQKNLKGVKTEEQGQEQTPNTQASFIQRTPDGGDYADNDRLNVTGAMNIGEWNPSNLIANALTGNREIEIDRIKSQRRDEINNITADTEIPILNMTKTQRIGLGLRMLGGRFWEWVTSISTVDVSLFAINLINPVTYILGAVGGIGLIIDGSINFVRDLLSGDVFGAIKSAGDAAMGLALLAGSITGLALLISLAVTVAMFFGFGLTFGPIVLPIMAKIMAFCGPIAYYAGITAAALNFIAGVKSLVDLGSAESAQQLQGQVNDLQTDATNTLTSLLMILVGRAGKNVGKPGGAGGGNPGGLPVGQGAVMLGEFGNSLGQRMAAFLGLRRPAMAGLPGYTPFVMETMPVRMPVTTGAGAATGVVSGGPTAGIGTMASSTTATATAIGTQTATQTASNNKKPKKRYKWWKSHKRLVYAQQSMNGGYLSHGHHVWPKNIGGPHAGQQLLQVAQRIHSREIHGVQGPFPNIHTELTNAIKGNASFASVLGNDVISHQIGAGNRKLITAMKAGTPQAALLKTFVKNTLISYYDRYRADSSPIMPQSSYTTGISQAEQAI